MWSIKSPLRKSQQIRVLASSQDDDTGNSQDHDKAEDFKLHNRNSKGVDKYRTIGEFDNCHVKFQKWS